MAMQRRLWVLLPLLCYFLPAAAAAPTRDKIMAWCNDSDPDLRIRGCSLLIQSGKEPARVLAGAFFNRGNAYEAKGQYDRSIQDFDSAIKLTPDFADAFSNRGGAYLLKNQADLAIKDFDSAIKLNPRNAIALYFRSVAKQSTGDANGAAKDLAAAKAIDPNIANRVGHQGFTP